MKILLLYIILSSPILCCAESNELFSVEIKKFDGISGEVQFRIIANSKRAFWVNIEALMDVAYRLQKGSNMVSVPGWAMPPLKQQTFFLLLPDVNQGEKRGFSRIFTIHLGGYEKWSDTDWNGGDVLLGFQITGYTWDDKASFSEVVEVRQKIRSAEKGNGENER